jgi:hypothetical protein
VTKTMTGTGMAGGTGVRRSAAASRAVLGEETMGTLLAIKADRGIARATAMVIALVVDAWHPARRRSCCGGLRNSRSRPLRQAALLPCLLLAPSSCPCLAPWPVQPRLPLLLTLWWNPCLSCCWLPPSTQRRPHLRSWACHAPLAWLSRTPSWRPRWMRLLMPRGSPGPGSCSPLPCLDMRLAWPVAVLGCGPPHRALPGGAPGRPGRRRPRLILLLPQLRCALHRQAPRAAALPSRSWPTSKVARPCASA